MTSGTGCRGRLSASSAEAVRFRLVTQKPSGVPVGSFERVQGLRFRIRVYGLGFSVYGF